eukprot:g12230.t1
MGWKKRELAPFGQVVWAKRKLYSDRVLCPAVTMSMTTPGYFVQEISTGKLFHTGDIIQVNETPEEIELPRKRPGRPRKSLKLLQGPEDGSTAVDWGELQRRGAQLLAQELSLLEEDGGEIINERCLKMLTTEVEEIVEEAVLEGRRESAAQLAEAEKAHKDPQEFLQARMVGLAEVRKSMSEWKPSMVEEYAALIKESEAVEAIDRGRADQLKKEAEAQGKDFDLVPAKAIFSRKAGVDATPRMLADLAWGLASLDLAEVEVYSVVQWQLARLAQGLDMKKPAKILKDFIKKSLVVVWVSSFQRCLHEARQSKTLFKADFFESQDGLYQVLAKRFNRLAKLVVSSVSSTTTAMPTHEHQIQPGDESPSIVLDLPDRLVVQKPPSWQARVQGSLSWLSACMSPAVADIQVLCKPVWPAPFLHC